MADICDLGAVALSSAIRNKEVSAREVAQATLGRIEARADLNAFITVAADEALSEAKAADEALSRGDVLGILHGLPYSVKDLLNTRGVRTTMGSRLFADTVPGEDAVSVARARAAGGVMIGKTTTPEFGHVQSATSPLFGRTLNPIDPNVTPGASSSGAAVAVAAGMGALAIGTDGGGSIRIPASCCGVVGMKPTLGAVPHLQLPDMFGANSYAGPMARDVADTALLFEAIAGPDRRDPFGQSQGSRSAEPVALKGLRIGWMATGGARVEREVAAITASAVRRMEAEGAIVEPVELDLKSYEPVFLTMLRVGLAARTGKAMKGREADVSASLVDTVNRGLAYSALDLAETAYARTTLFRAYQELFTRYDVIVSPTVTAPPLPIDMDPTGEIEIDGAPAGTVRGAWYPFTYAQNLTGHPAISLPCGLTSKGLPVGLQLCTEWYRDRYMLALAAQVEQLLA